MKFAALMVATALAATAPTTTITSGPTNQSTLTSPTFTFTTDTPGASFECSLDGGGFAPCTSPDTVGPLSVGPHSFAVRSVGTDGTVESTPPQRHWTLVASPTAFAAVKLLEPRRHHLNISGFRTLSGTAQSPSGVHGVYAALQRGGPDTTVFPAGCVDVDLRSARFIEQPCLIPDYVLVRGGTNWRYQVPAKVRAVLTPGKYTLIIRAFNGFDQAVRNNVTLYLR